MADWYPQIELRRDIDILYSKRWDIVRYEHSGLLRLSKRRIVKPNISQLNTDLEELIMRGPIHVFSEILLRQGKLNFLEANKYVNILKDGNVFFELMGRRCEAHIFTSDDIKRVEATEWFNLDLISRRAEVLYANNDGISAMAALAVKESGKMAEWCLKRWFQGGEGGSFLKNVFTADYKKLDEYRGRQELVRDILIKQGGYGEAQAEREMNDREFCSRAVVELMKNNK